MELVTGNCNRESTSLVSWSTSPGRAPIQSYDMLPEQRKSLSRESCFSYASGEHRRRRSQDVGRASPTVEPESSISNQWFNMYTERLLHRNSRSLLGRQAGQPQVVRTLPKDVMLSDQQKGELDNQQRANSSHRGSTSRWRETVKQSGAHGDFLFLDPIHDSSRKCAHGPQAYINDNRGVRVYHSDERFRPQTRGKHENAARRSYSMPHNAMATSAIGRCKPEWKSDKRTSVHRPNDVDYHDRYQPLGSREPPLGEPYDTSRLALPSSYAYEASFSPKAPHLRIDDCAGSPLQSDRLVHVVDLQAEHRCRLGSIGLSEGGLDAFDLDLLMSAQPEGQYCRPGATFSRYIAKSETDLRDRIVGDGLAKSPVHALPAEVSQSPHGPFSTFGSKSPVDPELQLIRGTYHKNMRLEVFNPYKKPHLFA